MIQGGVNMDEEILELIIKMQECFLKLEEFKKGANELDKRALSIAMTELETSMLWLANARK